MRLPDNDSTAHPANNMNILFVPVFQYISMPLTIGGLGIREVVFVEGAAYFGLGQEKAILISLLFYFITLITSAYGGIYVFHDPLQKKRTHF